LRFVATALGVGAFVLFALLVNGGYVYRTKCPLPSGGTETSWTYGINDVLPYIRSTSAPCKSHTGTRLALSEVGVFPIHDGFSVPSSHVTQQDREAADALANATAAISTHFKRERKETTAFRHDLQAAGFTRALYARFLRIVQSEDKDLGSIKKDLDNSTRAKDTELAEAQRDLSLWLAREIESNSAYLTSSSFAEAQKKSHTALLKAVPVVRRLQTLAPDLQAKYPNVKDWGFLPN
jgi:hypothetical protein